jgi:hypothetical protein
MPSAQSCTILFALETSVSVNLSSMKSRLNKVSKWTGPIKFDNRENMWTVRFLSIARDF